MPKVTQQYRDDRRAQILSAARRCFLRDGFHATSMHDLFAEAGLSSGAVYRYFASKDEMIMAIADDNIRDVIALVHTATTDRDKTSVGTTLANVLELLQARHSRDGIGGVAVQVWSEASRNPTLARQFDVLLKQSRAELTDLVRQHQGGTELPADIAPDALATVLISLVAGYLLQLALFDEAVTAGVPDALRALWPAPSPG